MNYSFAVVCCDTVQWSGTAPLFYFVTDKTMKNSFERVDNFIDKVLGERACAFLVNVGRYAVSVASIGLLVICTAHFVGQSSDWNVGVVRADLSHIATALSAFERDCGLNAVLPGMHSLHFLTSATRPTDDFAGFSLQCASNWKGPYINKIPVVQGYPYSLLKVAQGIFIVPSQGVNLPKGQVVGKDFFWTDGLDVAGLSAPGGLLAHHGEPIVRMYTLGSVATNGAFSWLLNGWQALKSVAQSVMKAFLCRS